MELIERLVLSLTQRDDWVFDPFLGTGTTVIAALRHERTIAQSPSVQRLETAATFPLLPAFLLSLFLIPLIFQQAIEGRLPVRPMSRPVFDPRNAGHALTKVKQGVVEYVVFDPRNAGHALTTAPCLRGKEKDGELRLAEKNRALQGKAMKIEKIYSHLNGLEFLLVHRKKLWNEVITVIKAVDAEKWQTKISEEKTLRGQLLSSSSVPHVSM